MTWPGEGEIAKQRRCRHDGPILSGWTMCDRGEFVDFTCHACGKLLQSVPVVRHPDGRRTITVHHDPRDWCGLTGS